jgi:glycosyltransferase involved in cell wall biosynthesis
LEVFAGTDLHLYICQTMDPIFAEIYKAELTQYSNIHVYGHIRMRSPEFEQLASLCNWTISATVCEGQPGATLECMAYGLIPILTTGANIDLESYGIFLPEKSIVEMRKVILDAAKMDVNECERRARLTQAAIKENYSIEKFNFSFKNAVQQIVSKKSDRSKTNPDYEK